MTTRPRRARRILLALFITFAAIAGSFVLLAIGLEAGASGLLAGLVMAVVPVPFYIAFATWVDRFEPEPNWLLATAFIWGASIAVLFAMIFNGITEAVFTAFTGAASASMLTGVLSAPFFEELAKGAALLLLFFWRRDEFDNVTDGIIYASMVGLGFAMTENVQYYASAVGAEGGSEAGVVFFLRGVMGPFSHPLYTSMTGIGLGIARESDRNRVKFFAPLLGLSGAMLLHAIWNLSASFGLVFFATYAVVMVPSFFAVIVIAIFSLRREARIVRSHLESVVSEQVLSRDDVIIVTSVRRRIGASTRALMEGGFRKWIARRRFHALATELAFHSWRASRFTDLQEEITRAELVDSVRGMRAKLGLPTEIQPPDSQLVKRLTREVPLPAAPIAMVLLLLGSPLFAGDAPEAAPAALRPFAPLVGTKWVAPSPNGKTTDEQKFEWLFDGRFLRNQHAVRDEKGATIYEGETIYAWDPLTEKVVWWSWNATGGHIVGTITPAAGGWIAEGVSHAAKAQSPRVRGAVRAITPQSWELVQYADRDGAWVEQPAITYRAVPPKTLPTFIVHFTTGPAWKEGKPFGEQEHSREHSANLQRLRKGDSLLIGARYAETGMVILRAESEERARAEIDQDPAVRAGIFQYTLAQLRPFYVGCLP